MSIHYICYLLAKRIWAYVEQQRGKCITTVTCPACVVELLLFMYCCLQTTGAAWWGEDHDLGLLCHLWTRTVLLRKSISDFVKNNVSVTS